MPAPSTNPERPWPGDFLLHPVCITAIAVLVVNDRIVKERWPGAVAGKLSDAAGMVFFPLLLVALVELGLRAIRRERLATRGWFIASAALVGAVFTATKTLAPVRDFDVWLLSELRWLPVAAVRLAQREGVGHPTRAVVMADATDVLCVPFVLVAVWIGASARRPPRARSSFSSDASERGGPVDLADGADHLGGAGVFER